MSHPEAEGIPEVADDTSTAWDDPRHPRLEDSPPAMPAEEPTEKESGPLKARVTHEEPDVGPDSVDERGVAIDIDEPLPGRDVGRLVEPDEGAREDDEPQSIASDSGEHEGLSAEEAAMHEIVDDEAMDQALLEDDQ
ncbi:DUF5709 domain-containing protein [Allorhizocola rhizosphaerae]|uniref:DUF5709 domain-containing protein n=1 Tax=Allorhizocola rhizosphaerae TaxID=1872709 RepID=UPI000E3BFB6B|nr:DUF5709 domain-containing protein [Allorhizocola rhizosphaerae]